jgi:hypothetical protein
LIAAGSRLGFVNFHVGKYAQMFSERKCDCGQVAMAFSPGRAPLTGPGGIVLDKGEAPRAFCLRCAARRGWLRCDTESAT